MRDNEAAWDKRLQIQTIGRDDTNSDQYRYPYEPTPYCVLDPRSRWWHKDSPQTGGLSDG